MDIRKRLNSRFTGHCWLFCSLVIVAIGVLSGAPAAGGPGGSLPPPLAAPKKPVMDVYQGVRVEDDYQWLENWNDPAVRAWSDAENRRARAFLSALPATNQIAHRLQALLTRVSATYVELTYRGGILFALKSQPPKEQPFLVALKSAAEPQSERVLVDPNRIDAKGVTAIDFYAPSVDGRLVAVSLSYGGSENGTVHVYRVATGHPLPDIIPRANKGTAGGSIAWNQDGTGFYYTRYPAPAERPRADLDFYQEIYFHRLGTSASEDTYALGKDFPRIAEIQLKTSRDGRYILATVANGDGGQFEHYLLGSGGHWTPLTQFPDGITAGAFGDDSSLYLLSKKGAPRGKILRLPLAHPAFADARTIVPQSEDVIQSFVPTAHRLYVTGIWGGPSDLRVFDLQGHALTNVPVAPISSVSGLVRLQGDQVLYASMSFTRPLTWFRYDPSTRKSASTPLSMKAAVDFSDTEVLRAFATSKDGTKIPMSILRLKGTRLDGQNPTLLTGYGGYGISMTPSYSLEWRPWLDQGGVVAIANLRGGGEYGEEWHKAGMLTRKQNVFDDFAACAEYLIHAGYTKSSKLAIEGGSNGGLLMGAELTQHPHLFRVVVSYVGIYDMLRNEATTPNAVFNVTEFGTVKDPAQFNALYAYSPYHHVANGTAYPAVLFFTGVNDPRVNPMQSRKMTARLQAATSSGLPILLRTSSNSGHIQSSLSEYVEETADAYAFMLDELDVKVRLTAGK